MDRLALLPGCLLDDLHTGSEIRLGVRIGDAERAVVDFFLVQMSSSLGILAKLVIFPKLNW